MHLDSVEVNEISVSVGDQICEDRTTENDVDTVSSISLMISSIMISFSQYVCSVPEPPDGVTEANVLVMKYSTLYVYIYIHVCNTTMYLQYILSHSWC